MYVHLLMNAPIQGRKKICHEAWLINPYIAHEARGIHRRAEHFLSAYGTYDELQWTLQTGVCGGCETSYNPNIAICDHYQPSKSFALYITNTDPGHRNGNR